MAGNSLAINAREILHRRDLAAQRVGRDPHSARLLPVSKGQSVDAIRQARALGLKVFAENYVQEWQAKADELAELNLSWHFIGHLQTNKAKFVVGKVDLIHSVDRPGLVEALSASAMKLGIRQRILIEVNLGDEFSKSGVSMAGLRGLIDFALKSPGLSLSGLMGMPPLQGQAEQNRTHFRTLRGALAHHHDFVMAHPGHDWNELSMGTSSDYEVAIEEGATWFRVGEAFFGPRQV